MASRIAVIGSSNMDLVTRIQRMPEAGETLAASGFAIGHGGKGANQAVAAARCGAEVLFVSCVGDDAFGRALRAGYEADGLATCHVRIVPGVATGTATILVEASGENRILVAAGANAALGPADIGAAANALAACGLIVLQLEVPLPTVHHALDWAAAHDIPVLLNPAPAHRDLDLARAAKATFLVPNQTELALLTGLPTRTRDDVETAARPLLTQGARTIVVTLGADGALVVEADRVVHAPAPEVDFVDTTGAGDAFIGSFAASWAQTQDVARAVTAAVRYAADTTTRAGAQASYATLAGPAPAQLKS